MKFSIRGQEKGDFLMQVTAWVDLLFINKLCLNKENEH